MGQKMMILSGERGQPEKNKNEKALSKNFILGFFLLQKDYCALRITQQYFNILFTTQ
ncbi:MAG: hypothetical protein ACM3O3_07370 [Syntrophothermus sp.]